MTVAADHQHRLESAEGEVVAEVMMPPKRWVWHCDLPPEWSHRELPAGRAPTLEAATAICNAIIDGTIGVNSRRIAGSRGIKTVTRKTNSPKNEMLECFELDEQIYQDFVFGLNVSEKIPVNQKTAIRDERWECERGKFYYMRRPRMDARMAGTFLLDRGANGKPRWYWQILLPSAWESRDAHGISAGVAKSFEAARMICETIAGGTMEFEPSKFSSNSDRSVPKGYVWGTTAPGTPYQLTSKDGNQVAEIIAEPARWAWQYFLPPEWSNGAPPAALARSLDAAKAICDAIAAGTSEPRAAILKPPNAQTSLEKIKRKMPLLPSPFLKYLEACERDPSLRESEYEEPDAQHTRDVMKTTSLRNYRWKRSVLREYELRPVGGSTVGEDGYRDSKIAYIGYANPASNGGNMVWYWSFCLPLEWWGDGYGHNGHACSIESAKVICETIVLATVESDLPPEKKPGPPIPKELPFKHGLALLDPAKRRAVERQLNFRFPRDLMEAYGDWSGGSLDGHIVFDTALCKGFVTHKFLALVDIDPNEDEYKESLLTHVGSHRYLKRFALNELPYIPFAVVNGAESEDDEPNPYNVPSLLVFERKSKMICVLSGYENRKLWVAKTWAKFIAGAEYRFDG